MKTYKRMKFIFHVQIMVIFLSITNIQEHLSEKNLYLEVAFSFYAQLSYSVVSYSFFAPEIKHSYKVEFVYEQEGEIRKESFDYANQEVHNMLHTTKSFFDFNETTQDLCARSWGVKFLNKHPYLTEVTIVVYREIFPTLEQYRQKQSLKSERHYQTTIKSI